MAEITKSRGTKTATTVFEDSRLPNLAINWKVGSTKLQLVHRDVPGGTAVLKETRIKGAKTDWASAQAEADAWFDSLAVFDFEDDEATEQTWED